MFCSKFFRPFCYSLMPKKLNEEILFVPTTWYFATSKITESLCKYKFFSCKVLKITFLWTHLILHTYRVSKVENVKDTKFSDLKHILASLFRARNAYFLCSSNFFLPLSTSQFFSWSFWEKMVSNVKIHCNICY